MDVADKEFILTGIEHGFDIVNPEAIPPIAEEKNHQSASPQNPSYEKINRQIIHEIEHGNYVITPTRPKLVSPLGAVPKPDGGVRVIHDCSRPPGISLNDNADDFPKQSFESVKHAVNLIEKGFFMAKVDLKSAYRSVPISSHSQQFTGLRWQMDGKVFYCRDKRLCFGSKRAPGIFHKLTQAVKLMMKGRGYDGIVAYLDDFLIVSPTRQQCTETLGVLLRLLRSLGFMINYNKVVDPCTCLVFLGVELDSVAMCMRLADDKLAALRGELDYLCNVRRRLSRHRLEQLLGRLSWCSPLIHGGRHYLQGLITAIKKLKHKNHKALLKGELLSDILWWRKCVHIFNGTSFMLDCCPVTSVQTDACIEACGGYHEGDFYYCNWMCDMPVMVGEHINVKETMGVILAAQRWAPFWRNKKVIVFTDNTATEGIVNKGRSCNHLVNEGLKQVFWLSVKYNFHLSCKWIPGNHNVLADTISRLHECNAWERLLEMLGVCLIVPMLHMSNQSISVLFQDRLPVVT